MSCRAGTGPALPLRDAGDHAAATVTATATGMGTGRRRSRTHALVAARNAPGASGVWPAAAAQTSVARCGVSALGAAAQRRWPDRGEPSHGAARVRGRRLSGVRWRSAVMRPRSSSGCRLSRSLTQRAIAIALIGPPGGRGFVVLRGCTRAAQVSVRAGQRTGNGPGRGSRDEAGAGSARITINRTSHNAYYVHERRTAGDTSRSLAAPRGRRDAAASGSTRTGALPPGLQWLCSPGVRPTDRLLRPQLRHSGQPAPA